MLGVGLALTSQSATSSAAVAAVPAGAVAFYDFLSGAQFGGTKTFARSGSKNVFDATGALAPVGADTLAVDYDPSTRAKLGALLEPARTNSLRNSVAIGAVAGTPGTMPTNWSSSVGTAGLSTQVVGAGAESGIAYLDIRFFGTVGAASQFASVLFDTPGAVAAATAQTWTASVFTRLSAGTLTGVGVPTIVIAEYTAADGYVTAASYTVTTPTAAALTTQRQTATRLFSGGGTVARAQTSWRFPLTNGASVDVTIRLGLPQFEQGATATSPIATNPIAAARAADVLTLTPASGGALTWRARYDDNSTGTIATGVTGAYAVDPAALARARVRMIWAATS